MPKKSHIKNFSFFFSKFISLLHLADMTHANTQVQVLFVVAHVFVLCRL